MGWVLIGTGILSEILSIIRWTILEKRRQKSSIITPSAPHPATLIDKVSSELYPSQPLVPPYPPPQYQSVLQEESQRQQQRQPHQQKQQNQQKCSNQQSPPPSYIEATSNR